MKLILAALGALLVLALAGAVYGSFTEPSFDPAEYARQQAEADRIARDAEIEASLQPLDLALAAAWRIVPLVAFVGGLAYLGAWGVAHQIRFRRERWANEHGVLPVLASDQQTARAALAAFHAARLAEAQQQPVPHSLTYSPHAAYHNRIDSTGVSELPALQPPGELPSFAQLLDAGRVGRGNPLLLGYDLDNNGAELPGSWSDLYSTATAGLPGTGKTTSQRFFACQTALHGARFVVCDPHASAGPDSLASTLAPLRGAFLVQPAEAPKDILEAARYVYGIGDARIHGKSDDRTPTILWVDELTSLLGRGDVGDDLAETLEAIAQEHRKVGVFLAASGQIWTAARTSSELRDSLASVLCHRMKRSQARLLLPTDEAALVERLGTGEAILWRTSGATSRVRIPNTTAADVVRVASLLGGEAAPEAPTGAPTPAPASTRSLGFRPTPAVGASEGAFEGAHAPPLRGHSDAANLTPEEARIVAAFLDGRSASDLAAEMAGGRKAGDAYMVAARRIADILRRALARTA